jgi:hypothetical protein
MGLFFIWQMIHKYGDAWWNVIDRGKSKILYT